MVTTKQRSAEQSEESAKGHNSAPESRDDREKVPTSEDELQGFLEQQITQAIEPVLAEFRAQMTQAVQQEMEQAFSANAGDSADESQQSDTGLESEVVEKHDPSPEQKEETAQRAEDSSQQKRQSPEHEENGNQNGASESGSDDGASLPARLTGRLQPLPSNLVHGLESKVGDWMQSWVKSLVMAGVSAALSEASRAAIQGAAEKALDALLQRTFDALPENSNTQELQTQTERTLHTILGDVFDAVYADDVRKELQAHGEKTAQSLIQRDMDGALDSVRNALQTVGEEIVSVLRRQWQKVLRLMLKVIMTALDSALPGDEQEKLPDSSQKKQEKETAGKR